MKTEQSIYLQPEQGSPIQKKLLLLILILIAAWAGMIGILWLLYEEPAIVGAEILAESEETGIEEVTEAWFQDWAAAHQGIGVPLSYQIKQAEILSIDEISAGYVEVHYQTEISGLSRKVIENLDLISTAEKHIFQGQWVLKWENSGLSWRITEAMFPVQYQLQSPEFLEEQKRQQEARITEEWDGEKPYYVSNGILYVSWDRGAHFTEVPDGYETIFMTPNGTYNEILEACNYIVSDTLTAFVGYASQKTRLLYTLDQGESWQESVIYTGGYRANTFVSQTDTYLYVTFAADRTGGSDYYATFRSSDLENWEQVSVPSELFTNAVCVYWADDDTGYYANHSAQFYLTMDGGASYEAYDIPECGELTAELGFNPYDTVEGMYREDGDIYMVVGQGDDADYGRDGKLLQALFVSQDGISFTFVEETADR